MTIDKPGIKIQLDIKSKLNFNIILKIVQKAKP